MLLSSHCLAVWLTLVITYFYYKQGFHYIIFSHCCRSFWPRSFWPNHFQARMAILWVSVDFLQGRVAWKYKILYLLSFARKIHLTYLCKAGLEKINWLHFFIGMKLKNWNSIHIYSLNQVKLQITAFIHTHHVNNKRRAQQSATGPSSTMYADIARHDWCLLVLVVTRSSESSFCLRNFNGRYPISYRLCGNMVQY
jgi:hypothetical protein